MPLYVNDSPSTRIWNDLQHPGDETHEKGTTLELDPGETVDMDTPPPVVIGKGADGNDITVPWSDPFLVPVDPPAPEEAPPETEGTEPAADAPSQTSLLVLDRPQSECHVGDVIMVKRDGRQFQAKVLINDGTTFDIEEVPEGAPPQDAEPKEDPSNV